MIRTETIEDGLVHTFSDAGYKIRQETGIVYDEAIDDPNSGHIYTETDEPLEDELTDTQALNILLGRPVNEQ